MEAEIDVVGRLDQLVRQPRAAAGAEDDAGFAKGVIHVLVPPAAVPKFDDVAPARVELADDRVQPRGGIVEARGQLEQQAAHLRPSRSAIRPKSRTRRSVPSKRLVWVISSLTLTV